MKVKCCSDTITLLLFALTATVLVDTAANTKSTPMMCNQTEPWYLGGRDIVADSKGYILLVALMPVQCDHCRKQLMKFQAVTETLPEIRVVVVAPFDENPRLIEHYRKEFPRVAIGMESTEERVWSKLSGSAHDHLVYDRCGRLATVIRHPKSDTTKFEDTVRALKLAKSYAQCGWCQYDPPDLPSPRRSITTSSPHPPSRKISCVESSDESQARRFFRALLHC